ncbi:MAG TPA: peptidoglycan DD-metalloendopeptidase family protein [Chloroflexota bacterium]|nr:peptidoglycan DD-metalloendopeptidase family protein [Chloroflexota bacterium]
MTSDPASVTAVPTKDAPASTLTPLPDPTAVPSPTAAPTPESTPVLAPQPSVSRIGPQGIVQPLWVGGRVLYYDQPEAGQGGSWSVDASGKATLERPQWGYYWANGSLLAAPRPARRDTYVQHVPSGREWTLPTTNTAVFSPDGAVVAYPTAAAGQPGGAPPAPGMGFSGNAPTFLLTNLTVSGADGQNGRALQLPINGSVVAWVPAPDGAPNARVLLNGRRAASDDPSYWAFDVRDRSLVELGRARRLTGALPSPDGTWMAHVAMWTGDPALDGLWVTATNGSARRRVDMLGGYRWTQNNRLVVIPHRASRDQSHELWSVDPRSGAATRLLDPALHPFRVSNFDWDCSIDTSTETNVCFVSAEDKCLWRIDVPTGAPSHPSAAPPVIPAPPRSGMGGSYRLPFATPPGAGTWYVAHWYGVTTGAYRGRNSTYSQGQGIHFGIDFAAPCGTEVVAVAPGRVIAIDGDFGAPPHNVVVQLSDGNVAMYGHLVERTRHVQLGQTVGPGQVVGNTGDSIAPYNCTRNPHLHLEIRKQGRGIATNPVPYFDANWEDASLGIWPGPRFERDLDNPRRNQFLDDQPDIWFGGPIITNFARPWPP